ncbi:fatty acid desaturase [Alteripontixanthobacter maritimus]|nr:fatty acid desaturase [Alteripontixanthobacter maritimus]
MWELGNTLVPFFGVIIAMMFAIDAGYYVALALAPVAGLLLLRLFIIQHDCGHGSFLRSRSANDWIGRALGTLTFTPYDCWKRLHALHHATTGNLDARGFGDIDTWTVGEFLSRGFFMRLFYRAYRHPIVLFGVGPAYLFLLRHRLPFGLMKDGSKYWVSAIATNLATAVLLAIPLYFFGIATTLWAIMPPLLVAASAGVWLFYIQHQFEEAHWDKASDWSFHEAALFGSSHLDLPQPLRWFTGNIGVHNVHHLASRIPFYRLTEVFNAFPEIRNLNRFTALQTFKATVLGLWDEEQRTLVTFREARSRRAAN